MAYCVQRNIHEVKLLTDAYSKEEFGTLTKEYDLTFSKVFFDKNIKKYCKLYNYKLPDNIQI
jgi:hypothetical protein